jgi:type IV secretory pathway TrbD component
LLGFSLLNRLFVILLCAFAADLVFRKNDKQIIIITALLTSAIHFVSNLWRVSPIGKE